jgi:hypothetical protein
MLDTVNMVRASIATDELSFSYGSKDAFHNSLNCETLSGPKLWSPPTYDDWPMSASRGESDGAAAFAKNIQSQATKSTDRRIHMTCMLATE